MALLAVLYCLGRSHRAIMLAFLVTAVVYILAIHIIVLVAAFQEGAVTGFLTLCFPLFGVYVVYMVLDNGTLKVLYGAALLICVALRLPGADLR
jgi:small-conductance mechanosensitive channel